MTELEKANKTIEELTKINEELGAYNGEFNAMRERLQDFADQIYRLQKERAEMIEEVQNEKDMIKSAVKESIRELIKQR